MLRQKLLLSTLLLLLVLGRAAPAAAQLPAASHPPAPVAPATTLASVTLYPTQDNTLYENITGTLSNGAGQFLFVGRTNQPDGAAVRRGLVQFDVAGALPANATILSATLYLSMTKTALTSGQAIGLHRALSAWGEGTSNADAQEGSGAAATPGDATWLHTMYSTTQWTTLGGDFVITPSASITVAGLGLYAWQTPALTSEVQDWLANPATNHGWVLLGNETTTLSAKRFNTREFATEAARPRLVIFYETPNYPVYLPMVVRSEPTIAVASVLTPFDASVSDVVGPRNWATNYGKTPELIVASNGTEIEVLAQDYNASTPWKAVVLRIRANALGGYSVVQALTDLPMLDRGLGLATDAAGNRYYATAVDESGVVNSTYPPLDTYRSNIVRVVKVDPAGTVLFNIDLDTARHAYNTNAEMVINPMTFGSGRLAVGGNEIAVVHSINTDPDWGIGGARHQKALSTRLDATTGAITRTSSIWVSHSFDQRLLYDGQGLVELHLGDAFPRYVALGRNHTAHPLFHIKGALGANNTQTRLGNLALIANDPTYKFLALFATESTAATGNVVDGPRNLAIVRVKDSDNSLDPSLPDTLTVTSSGTEQTNRLRWLTQYTANSNLHAERPKLVGVGNNQYVVLWEEWQSPSTGAEVFNGVYGMVIDAQGNVLHAARLLTTEAHLPRGDDAFLLAQQAAWLTGSAANQELALHFVDAALNYQQVLVK